MKRGIAFLNFGGPETLKDVKPFLYRLFCDPNILVGVPAPIRQLVALLIVLFKGPSSVRSYAAIGGGSPQHQWTKLQAEAFAAALQARHGHGPDRLRVVYGMRSWRPDIAAALDELKSWGADEVVLFPLFPQFSTTTAGSCLGEARRLLSRLTAKGGWNPKVVEIPSWPDHGSYVGLLKTLIEPVLEQARTEPHPPHLLFSAHSLPLKIIERGDPYPTEIWRTVRATALAAEKAGIPWSLAYQSRNGKMPWLEPYTENEIERLAGAGVRNLVVCPVSFVSDHIETLWELDMMYADMARALGVTAYRRVPTFNGDPRFIQVLLDVFEQALRQA